MRCCHDITDRPTQHTITQQVTHRHPLGYLPILRTPLPHTHHHKHTLRHGCNQPIGCCSCLCLHLMHNCCCFVRRCCCCSSSPTHVHLHDTTICTANHARPIPALFSLTHTAHQTSPTHRTKVVVAAQSAHVRNCCCCLPIYLTHDCCCSWRMLLLQLLVQLLLLQLTNASAPARASQTCTAQH
jgi:hypothetical protein